MMKLSREKQEAAWNKVKAWLTEELNFFRAPRVSDILAVGKEAGLSTKVTKANLARDFPSYQSTGRPKYPWPSKLNRSHVLSFYGTVSIDIAFFGKMNPELKSLGVVSKTESNGTLVCLDVATRYGIVVPLGSKGKSTQGILGALKKAFEMYKGQYGVYPFRLLSDQERGVMSRVVGDFLRETGTKLFTYTFSRKKSLFSENFIRTLRASIAILKKHHRDKALTWVSVIRTIVDGYNSRKIVLHGKKMSFSPAEITAENFREYEQEIHRKIKGYSLISFSIHPSLFEWKFPIGERVNLNKRAISVPGVGSKLSEYPLDPIVWKIVRRVVYLNVKNSLVKAVVLEEEAPERGPPRTTTQPELALVSLGI